MVQCKHKFHLHSTGTFFILRNRGGAAIWKMGDVEVERGSVWYFLSVQHFRPPVRRLCLLGFIRFAFDRSPKILRSISNNSKWNGSPLIKYALPSHCLLPRKCPIRRNRLRVSIVTISRLSHWWIWTIMHSWTGIWSMSATRWGRWVMSSHFRRCVACHWGPEKSENRF